MSHLDPKRPPSVRQLRDFALLVGGVFIAMAGLMLWRQRSPVLVASIGGLGTALALAGLIAPARLARVYKAWMALSLLLNRVSTPILMGVIYFIVVTPVALIMRLAGRRPLGVASSGSLWVTRDSGARRSALERQF